MGRMDEEQVVFEQLTLSNFTKWSSTALKAPSLVWENILDTESPLKMIENTFHLQFFSHSHDI